MPDAIDRLIARRKIIDASGRYGLPPALALGLAESESGFDQSATSRTGARGVFQFTRATAGEMGIDREDLDQNIDGGVRYLGQLLSETNDPAEAFRRYKGVSAGGATESDVSRALDLVSSHSNGKNGAGNSYSDRKTGYGQQSAEPEVDEVGYLIERRKSGADPIPSRAELDSLTSDLTPRRERIEAAAVEIMARKTALEDKRSTLRHSRDLPEFKKEVDLFNSDLEQYQAEVRAYDQDASRYHAGSRVFNRNAERISGHTVTRPGVPIRRVPVEEVPQGLAEAIPAPIAAPLLGVGRGVASLVLGFGALAEPAAAAVEQGVAAVEQEGGKTIGSAALRKIASPALRKIGETFRGWQEKVQDATIEALKPYEGKTIGSHPELKYDPVYMGNLIGNAVGSMAGYLVPGQAVGRLTLAGLGRVAPRLVQGRDVLAKGAQLFSTAGTGAMLESLVEAGDNYATALADPQISSLPPAEAEKIALTVFADTAKKSFPVTFATNLAGAYAPREGAAWFTKLAHVILDPTMEGVQEVLQGEAAHAALAKAIPDLPERTGRLEEFIGGAVAGGVVGGMRTLNQAARERRRRRKGGEAGPPGAAPAAPSPTTPPTGAPVEPELHARVLTFVSESPKPVSLLDLGKGLGIGPGPAREILEGLAEDGKLTATTPEEGKRKLYSIPGAAAPAAAVPAGAAPVPEPAAKPAPGTAAAASAEATAQNKQRALEIAQREGRISVPGIANSLNIPSKQARKLFSELVAAGELNSRGRYIGKTAADERAARQAPIAPAETETTYEAPEASHVPAERRGETAEVVTPQGTTAQAQWVLTDLGDVVASHDLAGNENTDYPQQYQGRQRERVASRAQIEEIARTFDPAQAIESRVSSGGAAIDVISEDGRQIVVSGNGRTLAQRLMYQLHPKRSHAYRKHLAEVLPKYGIDPEQMKGMKTPSLRRVLRGPVALGRFASESNAETVARRSPAEVAAGDARKLTPELLQDFKPSETGEIGTPANSGFVRDFFETAIPSAERGSYMQPDGTLSQEGERRLRNAIFARAYGDVAGVERLAESREDAARSVSDGMLRAAPAFAQMAADIESGNLHALDTSKDLAAAARKFAFLRTRGLTVDGFLAQQPMFERELSQEAERWLQVFDKHGRAPKRTGQILTAYVDAVRALGHPQQQPMFERGALPAKLDMIERAVQSIVTPEQRPALQPAPIPPQQRPVVQTSAKATVPATVQPPTPPKPPTRPKRKAPAPPTPAAPTLFEEAAEPRRPAQLPTNLAGAKPRYSYGLKDFTLEFESDLDRAAYITAQKTPSKRDNDYLSFVAEATGLSAPQIRAYGARVRRAIKEQAQTSEPGLLRIPHIGPTSTVAEAAKPAATKPTDQQVAEELSRYLEATGRAAAERLKARLRELAADTAGGITPQRISGEQVSELLEDLRAVGAWKVSAGAVRLQKFTDSMVAELGEWVREHIGSLHEAALDEFEATGETKRRELAGEPKAARPELAVEDLYPRAVALAKDLGRVSATVIAEDLAIPREEARKLYARLVRERVVNSVGRVIAAEAPAKKAEPKPETPPVEQVPIEALRELAEYDRRLPEQRPETREGMPTADYVSELARDLKEHGFEEPLVVRYDPARRVVALVEGNYRIAAAAEAGIQAAPVIVDVGQVLTDGRPAALKPGVETPRSLADIIQQPLQPLAPPQPQAAEARPRSEGPRFITRPPAIRKPQPALAPVEAKPEPPAEPPREKAQLGLFAEPAAEQPKYDYSSTQVNLPGPVAKRMAEAAARIPDQDLAEDGRETQPHVTVLYGLHGEDVEAVRELIENEPPIRLKFGKASFFPNDESNSGDVVKVDVESADLRRLNRKIGTALPNTQTQPGYKPHATIAYVKPGLGKKYTGKPVPGVSGQEITLDRIAFSGRSGRQTEIELKGAHVPQMAGPATLAGAAPQPGPGRRPTQPRFITKPPAIRRPEPGLRTQFEPPTAAPQQRLIGRVRQAINAKEDIRLRLEKLAQEIYAGSRAEGAFSKREIYEAQEAAVNSWLRDNAQRLHGMEFAAAEAELRDVLSRLATQTVRDLEQIERQQFSTPPTIAYLVAKLAAPQPSDIALEPSSGTGGLAALVDPIVAELHLNELDPDRAALAVAAGLPPATHHNAEVISAHLAGKVKPDLVVMNPPFTRGALQQAGKTHIKYGWNHLESALQLLDRDGRLVTILVGGRENFQDREGAGLMVPAARQYWNRIMEKHHVRAVVRIAGKEYAKYGTSMPVVVAVIDKTGPTPGESFTERAANIRTGDFATVEEAWNALENIAETRQAAPRDSEIGRPPAVRGRSGDLLAGVPALGEERGPQPGRTASDRRPARELGAGGIRGEVGRGEPGAAPDRPASVPTPVRAPEGTAESVRGRRVRDLEIQAAEAAGGAAEDTGSFVVYQPSLKGQPHQGLLVETKTMASVRMPPLTYKPSLPQQTIDRGKLSAAQLESVVMAGQANETILPDGSRGAALIGDGTGVGKGREIAAILLDNWNKGRKRLVWVTENWRLIEDARRDLVDIGAHDVARTLKRADKFRHGTPVGHVGVLFAPYSWIRAQDKSDPPKHRVDQLIRWVSENEGDGAVVVFDESHNLKNTEPAAGMKPSQTGVAVKKLLDKAPKLRTTYLSATAATDLRNLGYLRRLGLWGPKTAFPGGFSDFLAHLGRGGMSAMEMLARELKALGKYTSRTISYKGVILREDAVHALNDDQKQIYRTAAETWREVLDWVGQGIEAANAGQTARSGFMTQFYSGQQRFFNVLLTTMKVPTAVAEARKALDQNYSVVLSLINTNEATQKRQKAKMKEVGEEDEIDNLDFGPKDILVNLVKQNFPTAQWADGTDEAGNPIKVPVMDANGKQAQNPEAVKLRDQLIEKLDRELHLPANPLDILIEELGGRAAVAELTGRQEIYDASTGKFVPRGDKSVPRHRVNIVEAEKFQQGDKRIAILSNAAATGISLQADRTKKNLQKRLHITLQVGWSADKAMQMLGRTHRTNQEHAPEYLMIVSDMGGEKRFISTIARRLGTLGALTKGSREAAGANAEAISKVNFDSREGRQATDGLYNYLLSDQGVPGTDVSGREVLRQMGVLRTNPRSGEEYVADEDRQHVNRLLNRMLALDPDIQNGVYNLYYDMFDRAVSRALANGTLDIGVKELPGEEPRIVETTSLATDEATGAETLKYTVETQLRHQRASVEDLDRLQRKHPEGKIYKVINQRTEEESLAFAWEAPPIIHADGRSEDGVYVVRPDRVRPEKLPAHRMSYQKTLAEAVQAERTPIESQLSYNRMDLERQERYQRESREPSRYNRGITQTKETIAELEKQLAGLPGPLTEEQIETLGREEWQKAYDATPEFDRFRTPLIGGTVLKWWGVLSDAGVLNIYGAQDADTGQRIVGVEVSPTNLQTVVDRISGGQSSVTPRQLWRDVLDNATPYSLRGHLRVTRGRVSKEDVVRFHPSPEQAKALTDLGVTYERGVVPIYWVPRSKEGLAILERVLENFPVDTGGQAQTRRGILEDTAGELRLDAMQEFFTAPIQGLVKLKNPAKAVGDALDGGFIEACLKVVTPLETRIERAGQGAGRPIMEAIRTARDWGKVSAGKRLVRLAPAELRHLSRDQQFNLLDVLEGRADPMDERVDQAFRVVRPILDAILEEAQYLDVVVARSRGGRGVRTPIEAMEDYFPHAIRDTKTLKSGPVRRDILENLVRQGIRDNRAEAESFLDEYIEFVKGGGRLDQLLAHLQATGQATSPADALAKLNRYRMNIKRHGSLEHAREINLPFYDPNPARVLPAHIVATSVRLAQIAELGQDNQAIAGHIHAIAQKGDNYQWVEKQVNAILGWVNDTDDAEMTISRFLRATQIAKLGLAAIPNASQTFNTLLATDLPAVAAGLKGLLSKPGRVYAIESGALLDQFADASVRDIARTSRLVQAYLMGVGFTPVERANRIIAANAGAHYAGRLLNKLRQNPRHKRARRILAELGIDVDAALTRGQITGDELLLAANRISKRTQFTAAMEDYPAWAATPWGKLAFQFKTFIYSQTRFVGRELKGNIEDRDLPRLLRTLFLLTVLTQPLGEGIAFLRSLLTGRERDEEGLMRWLDNIAQVGGVGILWDMLQAAKYAPLSFIAGPSAQMVADIWKTVGTDPLNPEKWKKVGYRHGPEGRVFQRVIEGPAD